MKVKGVFGKGVFKKKRKLGFLLFFLLLGCNRFIVSGEPFDADEYTLGLLDQNQALEKADEDQHLEEEEKEKGLP